MIGPNFVDEFDCGSFFDHIDDLLDFPADDIDATTFLLPAAGNCESFPSMWSGHHESEPLPVSDYVLSPKSASDLSAELFVPYEDIVQLEWVSNLVEDSFSGGNKEDNCSLEPFQTSSPVSVLESSSSSCSGRDKAAVSLSRGRGRTKRPHPPALNHPTSEHKKKKKSETPIPQSVRKCLHCEITKTPQWRAGPMGPKTLCNACGVRHKSGRLYPEYRPAASPTFVPSIHSSSHKKVLEMRNNCVSEE